MNFINKKLVSLANGSGILSRVAPKIGTAVLEAKRVSPDVFFGVGLLAGIAAGVMGAKAYKEHDEVFKDVKEELENTLYGIQEEQKDTNEQLTNREVAELVMPVYGRYLGIAIRHYGPAILVGSTSVYFLMASHGIIKGRNKALMATVSLLQHSFSEYRAHVREELGDDADERYFLGGTQKTLVTSEEIDGKKKKTKSSQNVIPENFTENIYRRIFDATSPEFSPDKELNHFYLRAQEQMWNDLLNIRGFVMLNEVLEELHMPQTPEGAICGWALTAPGDDFIDFGIDLPINKHVGDNRFILNFNCNGVVYEHIGE